MHMIDKIIRINFHILFLFIFQSSLSQVIQNYQGTYNTCKYQGNVSYTYFEQDESRVLHGNYLFTMEAWFRGLQHKNKVQGAYTNGLKNGVWKNDFYIEETSTENLTGTFVNGSRENTWNYIFQELGYKNSVKSTTKVNVTFKKNNFSGTFSLTSDGYSHEFSGSQKLYKIHGIFKNNFCDSIWTIKYSHHNIPFERKIYFDQGISLKTKTKNLSNGEIQIEEFDSTLSKNLWEIKEINSQYYKSSQKNLLYIHSPNDSLWNLENIFTSCTFSDCTFGIESGELNKTISPIKSAPNKYKLQRIKEQNE